MVQYFQLMLRSLIWLLLTRKIIEANEGKIIGGRLAQPGEFPYQLCMYGKYRCGGALITLNRFITAAHCFIYKGTKLDISKQYMVAGVVDCNKADDPYFQQRGIVNYVVHPEYRNKMDKTSYHDFAVGILDKPFIENDRVKPGKIPTSDPDAFRQIWIEIVNSGKKCLAMGYGAQQGEKGIYSMQWGYDIRVIEVQPKDDKYCKGTLVYETDKKLDGEVCAVAVDLEKESMAPGDSGSGFVCDGYLLGVNTGGLFMEGQNLQLFTLAYPYLKFFTMDTAVSQSACTALVIFCVLTVASVNAVHL
ncbi:submandibular glandular kallikrein-9-like [Cimex lectularius]|uniref:Peptidase S1 domain-containing protein n=1 Tax=Cimex lectularius TaxID=79782 RepID=A0A8I6RXE2_CIMLE|nr:submandibular glandular kallikrein-9-like [Cimex lectularius]